MWSVWTQGACALTALYFFWSGVRVRGLCDRWGRWLCGVFWGLGAVAGFIWFKGTGLVSGWELEAVVVLAVAVTGVWGLGCAAFAPDRWRRLGRWVFGLGIVLSASLWGGLFMAFAARNPLSLPLMFVVLAGAGGLLFGKWPQGRICRCFRWGCVAGAVVCVLSLLIILLCCRVDSVVWVACFWLGWAVLGLSLWCLGIQFLAGLIPAKCREKTVTPVVRTFRVLVPRGRRRPLREWFSWRRTP